jgi:hypothetical protein
MPHAFLADLCEPSSMVRLQAIAAPNWRDSEAVENIGFFVADALRAVSQ